MTPYPPAVPPRRSAGPSPRLAAGSLRRTSSLDVTWPDGQGGPISLVGRARDFLRSGLEAGGEAVAYDAIDALFDPGWILRSISSSPASKSLQQLVGTRGGGGFRRALRAVIAEEQAAARPLAAILDDVPGVSLVSAVAWSHWDTEWSRKAFGDVPLEQLLKAREDVCIGHARGSSAQDPERLGADDSHPDAADLASGDDPEGWHALPRQDGVGFRRARRIDIRSDSRIVVDAEFQDSATRPTGGRFAVHEYGLRVVADPEVGEIVAIEVDPRVLPYGECPAVASNLARLSGTRLADLRSTVPAALAGAAGCTHLNDALRGLADVPVLLGCLAEG